MRVLIISIWLMFMTSKAFSFNCDDSIKSAIKNGNIGVLVSKHDCLIQDRQDALMLALHAANRELAIILLQAGVRADFENRDLDTPLILAVQNQVLTKRMLTLLLSNGANVEHVHQPTGMTAMMFAAANGFVEGVRLISEAGASMDRINVRTKLGLLDYASDPEMVRYLSISHRYLAKSLMRYGISLEYDALGFPVSMARGADGVIYLVTFNGEQKIAKICYDQQLYSLSKQFEYKKCKEQDYQRAQEWKTLFRNPMDAELFDVFTVKTLVKGKTLAQWLSGLDTEFDFARDDERGSDARKKLREFMIRMLRSKAGFVGDLNARNLIFSEENKQWVVIDGHKMVACFSRKEREWIWTEYCSAVSKLSNESVLSAFRAYAIGPNPTNESMNDEFFGVWLKERGGLAVNPKSENALRDLFASILPTDLD